MDPITAGSPLYWVQPRVAHRAFELHSADGRVLGTLAFQSAFGSRAAAESASGSWTFKRVGFLNARVTVREAGSDMDIAAYHPKLFGGGFLQTSTATPYYWKQLNFWRTEWAFTDSMGLSLVTFRPGSPDQKLSNLLKTQASVEISQTSPVAEAAQLSMLLMLGWYLIVMSAEDASEAAAVTATM